MPVSHTNRRGDTYYLHVGKTKTGKAKYYFSMKQEGTLADVIPPGFEIYEHPEGGVYLRRELPRLITDGEMTIVEKELDRLPQARRSFLERKLKTLTVYVADVEGRLEETLRTSFAWRGQAQLDRFLYYTAVFQFILVDEETRLFQPQRFCYLGSVDDWIDIGPPENIKLAAKTYLPHIGRDSYYELF